jgi:membrane fusion protein (multidrug efflux system)
MAETVETEVLDLDKTELSREVEADNAPEKTTSKAPRRKLSRWILAAVFAIAVAGASLWWLHSLHFESTDDAEIDGHLDLVSARISGTVTYINPRVEDNQLIEAGTLLIELDPRDYAAELEHAKANLDTSSAEARAAQVTVPIVNANAFGELHSAEAAKEQALASVESEQANLVAAQHKLQQDEAIYARAERDRVRYQALVEKREISRSDYDARETEATAAAQTVESDRAAITARERNIASARSLVDQREAQIEAAA